VQDTGQKAECDRRNMDSEIPGPIVRDIESGKVQATWDLFVADV